MNSMTGYGQATIELAECPLFIEVFSVNKKGFELILQCPREWQGFERKAQKILRNFLERGRIRISLSFDPASKKGREKRWDEKSMDAELTALENYCNSRGIPCSRSAELVLKLTESCRTEAQLPSLTEVEGKLEQALTQATQNLVSMRQQEGDLLKQDLSARLSKLQLLLQEIENSGIGMAKDWKDRLIKRLEENGTPIDPSDDRVLREFTLYAERCDFSEEITRIYSHLEQFKTVISTHSAMGRKLEFIVQELGREFNTLTSKSVRPTCSELAIDAKVELEKIREQVMNIE
jgi:uncharacterized protein (TIGR00255 family)